MTSLNPLDLAPAATATARKAPLLALLLTLGTALNPARSAAQSATAAATRSWTPAIEASRTDVEQAMAVSGTPGLSIAVSVDGEVVWAEGFGWADVEQQVPVQPHTKFRIASISKALTAGAMGRLIQRGYLDLDLPVQAYVAAFPLKRWPVTTRQLAGHQAGIRHYTGDEFASKAYYGDVVEALEIFAADSLLFEPGTRYLYSTYGWNLISAILQGATGKPYLQVMQEEVIEPLSLHETIAEHVDSIIPWRARFYLPAEDEGQVVNAPFVDNSNKWAGGGYLSTARDMARYGAAYLQPEGFLDTSIVELMWTPQSPTDGTPTTYGIGWNHAVIDDGRRRVWHTGGAMGGSTVLALFPDEGVVVSVLTNIRSARPIKVADAVSRHFTRVAQGSPTP